MKPLPCVFDNHMGPICLVRSDVFLYICFAWPGYIMAINCLLHNYHGSITSLEVCRLHTSAILDL